MKDTLRSALRAVVNSTTLESPMTKTRSILRSAPWLLGFAVLAAGCASENTPLNTYSNQGPSAQDISTFSYYIWPVMGFVFVAVVGVTIWLAVKNRVKPEDFDYDDLPEQVHGNPKLEWTWTAVPAVILAFIAVPTMAMIFDLEEKNEAPAAQGECRVNADGTRSGELDVMVIGQQWWWEYRYDIDCDGFFEDVNDDGVIDDIDREWPLEIALDDDDLVIANQLVMPVNEQVDLTITSRDVIHSFWLPALNGKRDAVPGRIHTWAVEASEIGEFTGWCTEYCGLSHARMRMSSVALSAEEFDEWLLNQIEAADIPEPRPALAEGEVRPVASDFEGAALEAFFEQEEQYLASEGRAIFQAQCTSCHVVREDGNDADGVAFEYAQDFESAGLVARAAPDLTHFATRTVYAGAIYSQYVEIDADDARLLDILDATQTPYIELSDELRLNEAQLKRWISNAPSQKAMDPENGLGMPAFPQLTEADLEALVAYLATLD